MLFYYCINFLSFVNNQMGKCNFDQKRKTCYAFFVRSMPEKKDISYFSAWYRNRSFKEIYSLNQRDWWDYARTFFWKLHRFCCNRRQKRLLLLCNTEKAWAFFWIWPKRKTQEFWTSCFKKHFSCNCQFCFWTNFESDFLTIGVLWKKNLS